MYRINNYVRLTKQISKIDDWRERRKHCPRLLVLSGKTGKWQRMTIQTYSTNCRVTRQQQGKEWKPKMITHRVVWSARRLAMKRQRLQQLGSIGVIRLLNPKMVAVGTIGVVVELGRVRMVRRGVDDVVGSREMIATAVPETDAGAFGGFI
jgi:hypothetical protein